MSLLVGGMLLLASGMVRAADGPALYAPCAACHGSKAEGNALADAGCAAGNQCLAARQIERVCHRQYRLAMGRSSAGKSEITSQPVSVTTTSSSIRAAE